ncbi:MAG: YceI family protein [Acidimicrobiia bacterium]
MRKLGLLAGGIVMTLVAGFGFYWLVLRDDPAPPAKIKQTKVATGADAPEGLLDGTYALRSSDGDSFVGYRVEEQFVAGAINGTATGRTPEIEGSLSISGTTVDGVTITANVQALVSDESRRDNRIRTSGLETDTFPNAEFVLDEPIELGTLPAAGETVEVTAVGHLTLHGVTRDVEIPLEARWDGTRVQVVGRLPIVFSDYDIDAPSVPGFVTVDDRGEMELQLFFEPE